MPTYMMNIFDKFHSNPSAKYKDIASREIHVNGQTDECTTDRKHNAIATYSWLRPKKLINLPGAILYIDIINV